MENLNKSQTMVPTVSHYDVAEHEIELANESAHSELEDKIERATEVSETDSDSLTSFITNDYKADRKDFKVIFIAANVLSFGLLSIIIYILIYWMNHEAFHPDSSSSADYNIHMVVHVLGTLILPAYSVVIFRAFPDVSYKKLVYCHIGLNITALLLTVYGVKVAYDAHHIYASLHMYSLHSWFGFALFILFSFELITGNYLCVCHNIPSLMKYFHSVAGSMILISASAATISGLLYRAQLLIKDEKMSTDIQFTMNSFGVLANLFAILIRYLCGTYRFRRRTIPTKDKKVKRRASTSSMSSYQRGYSIVENPFAEDTFEFGKLRKTIFIADQTYEQFAESLRHEYSSDDISQNDEEEDDTNNRGGNSKHNPNKSEFYGDKIRRGTLTRKSLMEDLKQLENTRRNSLPGISIRKKITDTAAVKAKTIANTTTTNDGEKSNLSSMASIFSHRTV